MASLCLSRRMQKKRGNSPRRGKAAAGALARLAGAANTPAGRACARPARAVRAAGACMVGRARVLSARCVNVRRWRASVPHARRVFSLSLAKTEE